MYACLKGCVMLFSGGSCMSHRVVRKKIFVYYNMIPQLIDRYLSVTFLWRNTGFVSFPVVLIFTFF
jgi:hypothetical protein